MTAQPIEPYMNEPNPTPKRGKQPKEPAIVHLHVAAEQPGPRAPKRVEWIPLAEEGDYAEHQVQARIRYSDTLNTEFASGDFERIKKALRQIVLAHNGWVDPDTDEPMAPATDDAFWDSLAQEEVLLMLRSVGSARKVVLSSLLETKAD